MYFLITIVSFTSKTIVLSNAVGLPLTVNTEKVSYPSTYLNWVSQSMLTLERACWLRSSDS